MRFSLIQLIALIAVFQLLLIACYFIMTNQQKARFSNKVLSAFFIIFAILIISSLVLSSGINRNFFPLAHLSNQMVFLIGPLVYFYIKLRLHQGFVLRKSQLVHVIPFVGVTSYLLIKFYFIPVPLSCRINHILIGGWAFTHSLLYLIGSLKMLKQYKIRIRKTSEMTSVKSVTAIFIVIISGFTILISKLLFFIIWDASAYYEGCNVTLSLYYLVSFLLFNSILYILLLKPQIFLGGQKYKHSKLSSFIKKQYANKLVLAMENDQFYLDPSLTLNKLSRLVEIPERQLSQVINESFDKNFYDFVNYFRIREALNLLSNPLFVHKTILEIAYELGFNSKSTFNAAFKKHTNTTPNIYRQNNESLQHFNLIKELN